MNYKIFSLVALLILATLAPPVSAANVYIDNNPAVFEVLPLSHGYLEVRILAGGSAQDLKVWVIRKGTNTTPFDAYYHPDGTEIVGQNKGYLKIEVRPDGISEPEMLAAGDYIAYLQNGNGNQLETREFTIGNGATERIVFQGSAVARINHTTGTSCIIPAHWEYRFRDWVPEGLEYVWHPEVNHTITVIDTQEWDEYIWHPEVNHTEYRSYTQTCFRVLEKKWFNNDGWKVKCTNHAEHGNGWHVQTAQCTACVKTYSAWGLVKPDWCAPVLSGVDSCIPCYYETRKVVDSEAWMEIIHHAGTSHEEIVVDEPAWGEWVVVSEGYWMEWSDWSTEQPLKEKGREIETRWVEKVNNCCCNCGDKKKR